MIARIETVEVTPHFGKLRGAIRGKRLRGFVACARDWAWGSRDNLRVVEAFQRFLPIAAEGDK